MIPVGIKFGLFTAGLQAGLSAFGSGSFGKATVGAPVDVMNAGLTRAAMFGLGGVSGVLARVVCAWVLASCPTAATRWSNSFERIAATRWLARGPGLDPNGQKV